MSFVGNGQNPACQRQEPGFSLRDKPHGAVDGSQPGIAAAGTTVALFFQMFQEAQNVRRVPILQPLRGGAPPELRLAITQAAENEAINNTLVRISRIRDTLPRSSPTWIG